MSAPEPPGQFIENRTFAELAVGDTAQSVRTLTPRDISLFAVMSGDVNPAHVDAAYAATDMFHGVIAHGMWGAALISAVLGTQLPGPGTIFLDQSLSFKAPVALGDTITTRITVTEKLNKGRVLLTCACINQDGVTVIDGIARVIAPSDKVHRPRFVLPEVTLHAPAAQYARLVAATTDLTPVRTAVVHPCDALSLTGALDAAARGIIVPVLIGPAGRIAAAAKAAGRDLGTIEVIDVPHSHAAAATAVALAKAGKVAALMQGALQMDELMAAVMDAALGLRTERLMSHVYVLDVPTYAKPLLITDAAINVAPDLSAKRDIVQNAIQLAQALGTAHPKVAILAAVETVTPRMPATLHAAALCKMADRGQITGGVLDGPLAFDNAISPASAAAKGIVSPVAGQADILVAPDLESAGMMAKQLIYLAGADAAGLVMGASVPVILTNPADSAWARLASCALARLVIG
jgi:phosphotransacetylase/acyl dehydratase